jgi:hypothetical protein
MDESGARYEAQVRPDGRILELTGGTGGGTCRQICPTSSEAIALLASGREVVYRFEDGGHLRGMPYLEVLEAMRRDVLLTAHKARHGELMDEPEVVPALRQLLAKIEATAVAFRRACEGAGTAT